MLIIWEAWSMKWLGLPFKLIFWVGSLKRGSPEAERILYPDKFDLSVMKIELQFPIFCFFGIRGEKGMEKAEEM